MRVTNYDDGVLDIEMPKDDYDKIIAILDQITEISYMSIESGMYQDLPELTGARFDDLSTQIRSPIDKVSVGDSSNAITVKLTEYSTYLLDAILLGAYGLDDENFILGDRYITEEETEDLHERFSLIADGLRPEKELDSLEKSRGEEIPRFKYVCL